MVKQKNRNCHINLITFVVVSLVPYTMSCAMQTIYPHSMLGVSIQSLCSKNLGVARRRGYNNAKHIMYVILL